MENQVCGIYCIENLVNGKKYVGLSVNVIHRFYEHRTDLNANKHYNLHLQNAWNMYGKDNFKFYVLEECPFEELSEKEKYYIDFFNANNPFFGYNGNAGGKSTTEDVKKVLSNSAKKNIWTDERKKELSVKMSGKNNPFYGKHHTEDSIKKIINNKPDMTGENNPHYGKRHSDEAKRKISNACKNKPPISDETREKLKGRVGEKNSTHKPIYCPELDRVFWGSTEVEQEGITKQSYISAALSGRQKTAGKHPETGEPLHWFFVNKDEDSISL